MIVQETDVPNQYALWPDDDLTKPPHIVATRPGQEPADVWREAQQDSHAPAG
ncbi:hypothetical protein [Azospirillum argentinense]|uniref:hypothetical protein n=1 Tax=Azospirillum TaxID=191 RepID=UPI0013B372D9|nr:hypothetical protein [Azospirillum brasilense]